MLFIALIVLTGASAGWLFILNKKHAAARVQAGKSGQIVDLSMQKSSDLPGRDKVTDDGDATQATPVGQDKSLDDVTDLKNEDFIYVY